MAQEVKVQPGHGTAGRHPTRQFLDTLSGHDDPGMFGRMFPTLEPLAVDDGPLQELAGAMKDPDPGESGGQQHQDTGRIHLSRSVRRPRHHARSDLDPREGGGSARHAKTSARRRSTSTRIYGLGPDGSRQLYARNPPDVNGKRSGTELPDRQDHQRPGRDRNRRPSQRSAAQPRGLRADRRSSQRREPGGRADASCDAQVPQQGLRPT